MYVLTNAFKPIRSLEYVVNYDTKQPLSKQRKFDL